MGLKSILQCARPDCNHRLLPRLWLSISNLQDWLFSLKNQSQPFHHTLGLNSRVSVCSALPPFPLSHVTNTGGPWRPPSGGSTTAGGRTLGLCPQIHCVCPLLSNNVSRLGYPWQVLYRQLHICPPHPSHHQMTHRQASWSEKPVMSPISGTLRAPPPHALFQAIPTGLPKLLQQKTQLHGNLSGDLTTAWSWEEGETSKVYLPTAPSAPRATSKLKYRFFSERALTAISPTVWGNNSLCLCKPLCPCTQFLAPLLRLYTYILLLLALMMFFAGVDTYHRVKSFAKATGPTTGYQFLIITYLG